MMRYTAGVFDPVDPKQSLADIEKGILQYWLEEDIFKRSVLQRQHGAKSDADTFSFYDGPPFATGLPHYGHLLAGTIKDVIPRYQTMRGKCVQRRFGWDCHGLPIENLIEQENNLQSKKDIEEMGVDVFNGLCRSAVQRYTSEWRTVVERMGRWVDMDWDYRTMDPEYMESMWWAFSQLYDKNLIYEGHKSMHICTRCVTPLSNFEVTQGYSDRTDMSVIMTFPLIDDPDTVLLAWTTTPWSLPGNLWLLVGPEIEYAKVKMTGDTRTFVLAKALVETVFKKHEHEIVGTLTADELVGKRYEPLFPYFVTKEIPSKAPQTYGDTCFYVMMDEHDEVSENDGTGIVHITNSHGEDGFNITKKLGIDVLHHLNMDGSFKPEVTDFQGMVAKPQGDDPLATDKAVIAKLKDMGRHFDSYTYTHSYPHCWRCDSPLLNYAASSWFVAVEQLKDKMLQNKDKTNWMPAHIKEGRYGKWLEGARDWAISRSRYWGTPLPIWRNGDDIAIIGSRDELMSKQQLRFTKLTAVRHGESEGNLMPIYQGVPPGTDLTAAGQSQAAATGDALKNSNVAVVYCSPLARTKQTAEAIAQATGAKLVVDDRLQEVQFGEYEGKTIDFNDLSLVKAKRAHKMKTGSPESIYHFDGMETWEDVQNRIKNFLDETLPKHRSEHIVVVTHADPIQNIKHYFTGENPIKISHQPYPFYAQPHTFFWDHQHNAAMDLHKDRVDDIVWPAASGDQDVRLTLARHGETDWNAAAKIQGGNIDESLNETGKKQAADLAERLKDETFDVIIASDLKRAQETAAAVADQQGIPLDIWPELRERNMGDWSNRTVSDILDNEPCIVAEATSTTCHHNTPENGESLSEFLGRAREAVARLRREYSGKRVLIVSHGGTTRALNAVINNLGYREAVLQSTENGASFDVVVPAAYERIPDVLDCWFESGSMPYSQAHFPFSTQGDVPPGFPADFIAEGVDQTRAWFYVLMVLSTALFDDTPFENVVVNGIVLAEDGKKMSKRLKNYPEPTEIVEKYGADAIRFTLMSSPAVRGEDLRMSERLVEESLRSVLLPLWNTYSFFVTYANAANFEPVSNRRASQKPLDLWIKAEVQDLTNRMTSQLDRYDLSATCNELHNTIDALTNWYIRLSRRRFAGKSGVPDSQSAANQAEIDISTEDQLDALHTLHDVLLTISQLLAPFCPFITDAIYLNLVGEEHSSIHLTDWPSTRQLESAEELLLERTRLQRLIVSLGLSVRGEAKIKNRQPLKKAIIAIPPALEFIVLNRSDLELIKSELNVKDLEVIHDPGSLAKPCVQVDARKVGPRLGGKVQSIIQAGKAGDFAELDDGAIRVGDEVLSSDEATIVYQCEEGQNIAADRGVVVSVDTTIDSALEQEGLARDLIRTVQRLRKESGLAFTDTILLQVDGIDEIWSAYQASICTETNSVAQDNDGEVHTVTLGDTDITLRFKKR